MLNIAKDKIFQHNPKRYCIFSTQDMRASESDRIAEAIKEVSLNHGCQIIVNGIIPTIKYYLRLIMSPSDFVEGYSRLVELDDEIKTIHKHKWNQILEKLISSDT